MLPRAVGSGVPSAALETAAPRVASQGIAFPGFASVRERVVLASLVATSLALHYATRIRGFGGPDEAPIGVFVLTWREAGVFSTDTYLNRTSPLYLLFARSLLDHGVTRAGLADALNVANVVAGALALIPMFVLFRRLALDPWTALLGVVTYGVAPTFFYGNAYGMPHIPAFAFLLTSLVCVARALEVEESLHVGFLGLATAGMACAAGMKADVLLCGLAFPALLPLLGAVTPKRVFAAFAVPALGLATALCLTRVALPVPVSNVEFGSSWSKQFPFDPSMLVDGAQLRVLERSLGPVLWTAEGLALAPGGTRRGRGLGEAARDRQLVILTLAWGLPALLFWGMIDGHSLRHLTASLCPVALLFAVGLRRVTRSPSQAAALAGLVLFANYFWLSPTRQAQGGTPRLFATLEGIQAENDRLSANAERVVSDPSEHKLLVGGIGIPTAEYALLEGADHFVRRVLVPGVAWDLTLQARGRPEVEVNVRSGVDGPPPGSVATGVSVWHADRER